MAQCNQLAYLPFKGLIRILLQAVAVAYLNLSYALHRYLLTIKLIHPFIHPFTEQFNSDAPLYDFSSK